MKYIFSSLYIIIFLIYSGTETAAQDEFPSNKGRDFWINFMPNFHNDGTGDQDSLMIFIAATVPTTGTINYGNGEIRNFSIPDPAEIYQFRVQYSAYEIFGYNYWNNSFYDGPLTDHKSFHVVTDNDVTVYAHSSANFSNEAFTALPVDALGYEYYIMSYNSNARGFIDNNSTPSQFSLLAVEDNTNVTITPSGRTVNNGLEPINIVLNKGQSYLVQAFMSISFQNIDLTGSYVNSDKPIAVFGGHKRAAIPGNGNSRDMLIEQMVPVNAWGLNAFLVPFPQPEGTVDFRGNDIFRIIAANDNTELLYNDDPPVTINKGEFIEGILEEPAFVRANKPILVAQFKKTSNYGSTDNPSDPAMMLIPPKEQFDKFYRFLNIQVLDQDRSTMSRINAFPYQYIMIVAPNNGINGVKLDGNFLNGSIFERIPTSDYSYTVIEDVADGVHTIDATTDVGIYVFGYGYANSYAYFGGMNLKPFDNNTPKIQSETDCYIVNGVITEEAKYDSFIDKIFIPQSNIKNVTVDVKGFKSGVKRINFKAMLNDKYEDGYFELHASDSSGLTNTKRFDIPGFTIGADNPVRSVTINEARGIRGDICFDVTIENYGKFPHTFNINFKNGNSIFLLNNQGPVTLLPGENRTFNFCWAGDKPGTYIDSLIIEDECTSRMIAAVNLMTGYDENPPGISTVTSDCRDQVDIRITDTLLFDYGIESIDIMQQVNCEIDINKGTPTEAGIKINVTDRMQDALYSIEVIDSAGLTTVISDTIPGFTLSFGYNEENIFDMGKKYVGDFSCDSLPLVNYGNFPILVDEILLSHNIQISIPLSQLPVTINPKDTVNVIVCFKANTTEDGIIYDTISIDYNCIKRNIILTGEPVEVELSSTTICGAPVRMEINSTPEEFEFIQVFPVPAESIINVEFALPYKGPVTLNIHDTYGSYKAKLYNGELEKGYYNLTFNIDHLASGVYYLEIIGIDELRVEKIIISK